MPSIVLILSESSYRADDFLSAAGRLGLEVITASDRCHVLAEDWTEGSIPVDFTKPEAAARKVAEEVKARAPVAVLGTDDRTAVIVPWPRASLAFRTTRLPPSKPPGTRRRRASGSAPRECPSPGSRWCSATSPGRTWTALPRASRIHAS
jgi:hypothetical protein